jgi:hypothetical protein
MIKDSKVEIVDVHVQYTMMWNEFDLISSVPPGTRSDQ